MNPPSGARTTSRPFVEAVADGIVDVFATDHAPHTAEEKAAGFAGAPFGIVGLETAVPLLLDRLVRTESSPSPGSSSCARPDPARLLGLGTRAGSPPAPTPT